MSGSYYNLISNNLVRVVDHLQQEAIPTHQAVTLINANIFSGYLLEEDPRIVNPIAQRKNMRDVRLFVEKYAKSLPLGHLDQVIHTLATTTIPHFKQQRIGLGEWIKFQFGCSSEATKTHYAQIAELKIMEKNLCAMRKTAVGNGLQSAASPAIPVVTPPGIDPLHELSTQLSSQIARLRALDETFSAKREEFRAARRDLERIRKPTDAQKKELADCKKEELSAVTLRNKNRREINKIENQIIRTRDKIAARRQVAHAAF